jgi:hypothetical protein
MEGRLPPAPVRRTHHELMERPHGRKDTADGPLDLR